MRASSEPRGGRGTGETRVAVARARAEPVSENASPFKDASPFKGVLLDLFGTLVPVSPRSSRAPHLHQMARALGVDPTTFESDWAASFTERVVGRFGPLEETIRHLARRQGVVPSSDGVHRALEIRLAFSGGLLGACEPVLPALDSLRNAGVRLAVVSDTSDETPRLWDSTPLASRFAATVFSCVEGFQKPDPRMYRIALQRLGLTAAQCAYVGDGGSHELTGATDVGLSAFLYRFPDDPSGIDGRYQPDLDWRGPQLKDLRELRSADRYAAAVPASERSEGTCARREIPSGTAERVVDAGR